MRYLPTIYPTSKEIEGYPSIDKITGRRRFDHAPVLPWDFSSLLWKQYNQIIDAYKIDKHKSQFVLLKSSINKSPVDFSQSLSDRINNVVLKKNADYPDNEWATSVEGAFKTDSVYIVGSLTEPKDVLDVKRISHYYREELGAKLITLVAPYLFGTRQDKNIESSPPYKLQSVDVSIDTLIESLAPFVDRMIVGEPHSSATQTSAARHGIPLLPISPWASMTQGLFNGEYQTKFGVSLNPSNTVVIGPDEGRMIASEKIAQQFGLPKVAFEKTRLDGSTTTVKLKDDSATALIQGKEVLMFDDEGSTFGTFRSITEALASYQANCIVACIVHGKFTGNWNRNINHNLVKAIIVSDSRAPVGNIDGHPKIFTTTIAPAFLKILTDDMNGVNFWEESSYQDMIVQAKS